MAIGPENRTVYRTTARTQDAAIDQGLRSYMLGIYNYVGGGLVVSAVVAYLFSSSPALFEMVYRTVETSRGLAITPTGLGWVAIFAPLGLLLWLNFGIRGMSTGTVQAV